MDVSYCNSLVCGRLRSTHWIFRFICLPEIPHLKKFTTLIKLRNKILCLYIAKFALHPCASVRNISQLGICLHQPPNNHQASQSAIFTLFYLPFQKSKDDKYIMRFKRIFLLNSQRNNAFTSQHCATTIAYIYLPASIYIYYHYHCCHHIFTAIEQLYVQKSHVRTLYSKTEYIFSHSKNYRKMYSVLYFPYVEMWSATPKRSTFSQNLK